MGKRLAAVGYVGRAGKVLRAHVLEPLAVPERQQQVLLLGRRLHHARVGQDDGGILVAVGHAVDHDAVELARLHVLLLHVDVRAGDAVVEDTLGNLQLGTLLLHRHQQLVERTVGIRAYDILEVERQAGNQHDDDDEPAEGLHQRDAGGLDGCQLRRFAKITKCDEARQEDGQREGLRHQHQAHIPEELRHDFQRQTLAYQFVDVSPQELHHQHELADEKGSGKQLQELLGYKYIKFFNAKHCALYPFKLQKYYKKLRVHYNFWFFNVSTAR